MATWSILAALLAGCCAAGCSTDLAGHYQGSLSESASLNIYPTGVDATKVPPRGVDVSGLTGGRAVDATAVVTKTGQGRYRLSLAGCELGMKPRAEQRMIEVDDSAGGEAAECKLAWPPEHPEPIALRFAGTAMLDDGDRDRITVDLNGLAVAHHITGGISLVFHGARVK